MVEDYQLVLWRRAVPSRFPKEFKHIHLDNLSTPKNEPAGRMVVKMARSRPSLLVWRPYSHCETATLLALFELDAVGQPKAVCRLLARLT